MAISKIKLGQIGEIRMCKRILKSETSEHGDVPFYKIGTFGETADVFISREKFEEYRVKYNFPKVGDILLSAAGTIGRTVRYNGEDAYFQDSNIVWIENDETIVLNDYLYYVLKYKKWQPSTGSTILRLYNDDIRNTEVIIHTGVKTQETIAFILSSLDRKIALNRKANEVLESMAKQLYDYWFVQFDFPNDEGKPYKSSGGKMVYNETLKREIPEGWEVGKFEKYVEVRRGGSPRPIDEYLSDKGYRWLKISDATSESSPYVFSIQQCIKEKGLNKTVYLEKDDLVLSNSATPGLPKFLGVSTCIHDGWLYFPQTQFPKEYLYLLFLKNRKGLVSQGNGSIFVNLKTDILKMLPVFMPDDNILRGFIDIVNPIFEKIKSYTQETLRLTSLRDYLLPLLMNGQVKVS